MTPFERLNAEFLSKTSALRYKPNLEGQRIEDGVILVGDKAGPAYDLSNLCHELSHFVEIDDARMTSPSWGLRVPEVWVYNRMCIEPETIQMTERELRVTTFQKNLMDYLGFPVTVEELVASLKYLADYIHVPLEDGSKAWGSGRHPALSTQAIEESQFRWRAAWVYRALPEFSIERFRAEWNRKVKLLGS